MITSLPLIVNMVKPVTKAAWLVNDTANLPQIVDEAFRIACSGRPGPVVVDLPMDVQRAEVTPIGTEPADRITVPDDFSQFWQSFTGKLAEAERPLILVGGGIQSSRSCDAFRRFAARLGVPVVNSLMAVDVLPFEDSNRVGLIGSYGNRWANIAIAESDLMLVLGSRLDVRQTGADAESFRGDREIYHVDCTPDEMNKRVTNCHTLVAELPQFFAGAEQADAPAVNTDDWRQRLRELEIEWPDTAEARESEGINPNDFIHQLSACSKPASAFVADVGQHQMWAAQSLELSDQQRFLTSGGMGAMGFGLPAAIGASCASGKPVVMIAGDGGFQLNIQELQTIRRRNMPIKMVVMNNQCHGMVRQFQESYFKERYYSTVWGYSAPSFTAVAEAYEIPTAAVADPSDVGVALEQLWQNPDEPFLLEVGVHMRTNAYPKLAFGRPISEMEPLAKPLEMEGT